MTDHPMTDVLPFLERLVSEIKRGDIELLSLDHTRQTDIDYSSVRIMSYLTGVEYLSIELYRPQQLEEDN